MDQKKPIPLPPNRPLGSIHSPHQGLARGGPDVRLDSLRSTNPTLTLGGAPKPEFAPRIVARKLKPTEDREADLDKKLPGPIPGLWDAAQGSRQFKPHRPVFKPKSGSRPGDTAPPPSQGAAASPFAMGPPGGAMGGSKRRGEGGGGIVRESDEFGHAPANKELEIDALNPYHPSVLPFLDPRKPVKELEEELVKKEEAETEESEAPEVLVDAGSIPIPLMQNGEFLNEDNLFFIQLPSALPFTPPPPPEPKETDTATTPASATPTTANPATNPATNPAAKPPQKPPPAQAPAQKPKPKTDPSQPTEFVNTMRGVSGHLGKILVYKSGKVKFRVGHILYDITAANNPNFLEELMVLGETTCHRVGPMSQHLIVTPDLEDLLKNCE